MKVKESDLSSINLQLATVKLILGERMEHIKHKGMVLFPKGGGTRRKVAQLFKFYSHNSVQRLKGQRQATPMNLQVGVLGSQASHTTTEQGRGIPTEISERRKLHLKSKDGRLALCIPNQCLRLVQNPCQQHGRIFTPCEPTQSIEAALVVRSFRYGVPEVLAGGNINTDPMIWLAIPSSVSFEGEGYMAVIGTNFKLD
eukprot:jgi/Psemu1/53834/gm1.53834_g